MTLSQTIIFYVFFFIAAAIVGFPRVILRKHPTITSKDISLLRPKLRWITYLYTAPLIIFPTILLVLLIAAGSSFGKPVFNETFLFFPVILFLGFYDGVFARITGLFPAMTRWKWDRFFYDEPGAYRWMAHLQILLALLGTLISLAFFLFYPG